MLLCFCNCNITAQTAVVNNFNDLLKKSCSNPNGQSMRRSMDNLFPEAGARVDNSILDYFYQLSHENYGNNTNFVDNYLNHFQKAAKTGASYSCTQAVAKNFAYLIPIENPSALVPTFAVVDYTFSYKGKTITDTDVYIVINNKIWNIWSVKKEKTSGIRAMELYVQKKYDEAFPLFQKLARTSNNYLAKYCVVVMELKKQGCKHMSNYSRKSECAKLITEAHNDVKSRNVRDPFAKELYNMYYRYSLN